MSQVIGYIRLVTVLAVTFVIFGVYLAARLLVLYHEPTTRRLRRVMFRAWGRCALFLIGVRLDVRGAPPKPPFFMVANHLSYIDVFVLSALCGPVFVARSDMANWPLVGFIMRRIHMVFISREKARDAVRVNEIIDQVLRQGDCVVVFPESGTSNGKALRPFKPALIQAAAANGYPVYYTVLHYATHQDAPPASEVVVWFNPEDALMHHVIRLFGQRGFTATVHFCEEPLLGQDRKLLAAALQEAVDRKFIGIA